MKGAEVLFTRPIPAMEAHVFPTVSCRRKGAPDVTVGTGTGGRLMLARSEGRTVAVARRMKDKMGVPFYWVELPNAKHVGSIYGIIQTRLHLRWAGAYYLGLEARGLA